MPRIAVMSDLHIEFEPPSIPKTTWLGLAMARNALPGHPSVGPLLDQVGPVDLVLVAGDTHVGMAGIPYLHTVSNYLDAPVVTIMGNHEPYNRTNLEELIERTREAAWATNDRVTFLEDEFVEIGGVCILGCTLWTDYALHGDAPAAASAAYGALNDHSRIRSRGLPFTPYDALQRHYASRAFLEGGVRDIREINSAARIVIMTHHAPIAEANPPQYRMGALAPAFASDLRPMIAELRPDLWVSGHTHHDHDMMIGPTRVLSAQRGYVGNEPGAEAFRPVVIDI